MKYCKYRITVQGLSNGIFVCKLLNSPVYCPDDDTKCFNTLKQRRKKTMDRTFCETYCKGYQQTGKCFADGTCKEYDFYVNRIKQTI